jgi:hypothetical protein
VLEAEAILERLDRCIRELEAAVAASMPAPAANCADDAADDLADALIDTTSAAARFGFARDTIAKMCREVDGIGVWKSCRWQVRVT